ncbi:unnamed protein product [Colias eurytheme]|nr:unnamed protein product [Colias eurytheme]
MNDVLAERVGRGHTYAHVVVTTRVNCRSPCGPPRTPRRPRLAAEPSMQISSRRQQMDGGINKPNPLLAAA